MVTIIFPRILTTSGLLRSRLRQKVDGLVMKDVSDSYFVINIKCVETVLIAFLISFDRAEIVVVVSKEI